jgi:probable F420-dependent oxidoreductase
MQAIWHCWETQEKLDFNGEFYQHNLMTPMFTPSNKAFGAPAVNIAAVGPLMTEVAAEVANGVIAHGFTTVQYLREVTLPAITRGLEKSSRERSDIEICCPIMVVSGTDEQAFERSKMAVRGQLGFYASTPAYRPVLDLHGWGALQTEAKQLTRDGRWQDMAELISDEILHTFAVVSEDIEQVPGLLSSRFEGLVDTWQCTLETGDAEIQSKLVAAVQGRPDQGR